MLSGLSKTFFEGNKKYTLTLYVVKIFDRHCPSRGGQTPAYQFHHLFQNNVLSLEYTLLSNEFPDIPVNFAALISLVS